MIKSLHPLDDEIASLLNTSSNPNYIFNKIVDGYKEFVYFTIRRIVLSHEDADDLAQETFIKVWKNLSNFKQQARVSTWLYRIAVNESLQFLRKQKILAAFQFTSLKDKMISKAVSEPYFDADDATIKLQKAILSLPTKQQVVFNLRHFEDLSYEQIAEITDTSVGALKASYHHAKTKIEKILSQD